MPTMPTMPRYVTVMSIAPKPSCWNPFMSSVLAFFNSPARFSSLRRYGGGDGGGDGGGWRCDSRLRNKNLHQKQQISYPRSSNNRPAAITQRVVTYSRVKPYQTVTAMWQLNWYHVVWSTTGNWHEGAAKLNWYYHNFQKSLYRGIGSFVSCTMAHHVFPHPLSFSFSGLLPSMHEGFVDCFHCWGPSSSHRQWPGASNGGGMGVQFLEDTDIL